MKKRILVGFSIVLFVFLCGGIAAIQYITKTTERMENLITLHQVEILRENLIIRVEQVQSYLNRHKLQSRGDVDVLTARIQEMDRVMETCGGCHHSPELNQGILAMRDMANDYKTAINHLITANAATATTLEQRTREMGQELITVAQGIAFTANNRLQQKTLETLAMIRKVRDVLYVTAALGIILSVWFVITLFKKLELGIQNLISAIKNIGRGELQNRVDISEPPGSELRKLADALNSMTENLHRSQRHLMQSAKLSAIGELATNIAYEVSNPLDSVLDYSGLLLAADDIPDEKKKQLKKIEHEILRARTILRSLLDFSRRKPPQLVMTDISKLIYEATNLAHGLSKKDKIDLLLDCPPSTYFLAIDEEEIRQVIVNLINNSCSLMSTGGTLTLRCARLEELPGQEVLVIEIADTGHGIPGEHLEKIFDPFFAAYAGNEGMGIELAISYMIVQDHGGRIEVDSTVGKGTVFRIILPFGSAGNAKGSI
jgi:signal transduction histidine kinase